MFLKLVPNLLPRYSSECRLTPIGKDYHVETCFELKQVGQLSNNSSGGQGIKLARALGVVNVELFTFLPEGEAIEL